MPIICVYNMCVTQGTLLCMPQHPEHRRIPRTEFIGQAFAHARHIVEYGAGASTFVALRAGATVISVESDTHWLDHVNEQRAADPELVGTFIGLHVDIGKTKSWGYPDGAERWQSYPLYARRPWQYCQKHSVNPDLVFIDSG